MRREGIVRAVLVTLALALVLRMIWAVAWQCDDAYITHRTAWNVVNGHGLTWNVGERVQAFTHPLWLVASIVCHLVFGEVFYSLLVVSAALLIGTLVGIARLANGWAVGLAVAALVSASAAVVDFGVSGLENPLLFALLVAAVPLAERPPGHGRLVALGLLVSALFLTRPDAPVFVAPLVLLAWWTTPGRARGLGALALGAVPLLVWEVFSLVWFGALVPNTAIAKLNLGISREELVGQGLAYLADAATHDPVALALAAGGVVVAGRSGGPGLRALAAGIAAYLAYVVWIGGDFMSLRFFGAPAVLGGALLARAAPPVPGRTAALLLALAAVVGLVSPGSRWRDDGHYADEWTADETLNQRGIANERAFYGPRVRASWVWARRDVVRQRGDPTPPYERGIEGRDVARGGYGRALVVQAGYFGYFAGPGVYVVDRLALTDAFVARIPYVTTSTGRWRVGHYERAVPDGYNEMAASGQPAFGDPKVDAAFSAVALVTRGPLWAPERWRAIWALHTGVHDAAFASLSAGVEPEPWPGE